MANKLTGLLCGDLQAMSSSQTEPDLESFCCTDMQALLVHHKGFWGRRPHKVGHWAIPKLNAHAQIGVVLLWGKPGLLHSLLVEAASQLKACAPVLGESNAFPEL